MNAELGFAMAGIAGLSLGLIGGGGSLLTVPILVYGFQVSTILGTAYSLFIVGITSLVGAIVAFRRSQVVGRTAFLFALPSFLGLFLARNFILHELPVQVGFGGNIVVGRESLLMGIFGLVMVLAAILTMRNTSHQAGANGLESGKLRVQVPILLVLGFGVGALTGVFGAGGGFLIVPALVIFAGLPMEKAVGTSLAIIAANAWFGLSSDLGHHENWNWRFILAFSGFSLAGVVIGQYFSGKIRGSTLKMAFAWTTFILGLAIFLKELTQGLI